MTHDHGLTEESPHRWFTLTPAPADRCIDCRRTYDQLPFPHWHEVGVGNPLSTTQAPQ